MRRLILAVLGLMYLAQAGPGRADVDLTGRWADASSSFPFCLDIVQTGTALVANGCANSSLYGSGTIDPATGVFTLSHDDDETFCPPPPPGFPPPGCVTCGHALFDGTAALDGQSFSGTWFQSVLRFPGECSGGVDFGVAATRAVCGDGIVHAGAEDCEDGNTDDGDCCSASCRFDLPFTACSSGPTLCGSQECDGAGTCVVTPPATCSPAGQSTLLISAPANEASDKLLARWRRVPTTPPAAFGNPTVDTDYALCVYAGATPALVAQTAIPADAAKWRATGANGFRYTDPSGAADGMTKIVLKSTNGAAKALVSGKGTGLPDPALGDLPLPITARLVGSNGICLEGTFDAGDVTHNSATKLKGSAR